MKSPFEKYSDSLNKVATKDYTCTKMDANQATRVADIRKALSNMRKQWENHSPITPIYTSTPVLPGRESMSEFSFKFVINHYAKRHTKAQAKK